MDDSKTLDTLAKTGKLLKDAETTLRNMQDARAKLEAQIAIQTGAIQALRIVLGLDPWPADPSPAE